jgi:hypothetical protein
VSASELDRIHHLQGAENDFSDLLERLRRRLWVPERIDAEYERQVRFAFDDFTKEYERTLRDQMLRSAELAGTSVLAGAVAYCAAADVHPGLFERFVNLTPGRVVDESFSRILPSGYSLSERVWDLNYSRDIIAIVENGVSANLSPEMIARQLDGFVLANREITTYTPYGRALNFDSMRLARTEIGHAYRQAAVENAKNTPWVTGLMWVLSLEHPDSGCDCEDYDGIVYSPEEFPQEPHPQCLCDAVEQVMGIQEFKDAMLDFEGGTDEIGIGDWLERMAA